ncbi:translation initiation factor SUI1 [gut metagenome]|uniref:Translation initiation factor SUI1 n=1 Tax=gut metagenome TaxID=749906 RepID=J9GPI4_9ZZZZ
MANNDWKSRLGVVYSTNQDYQYETDETPEIETLPIERQRLRLKLDRSGRSGKTVTLVSGFVGSEADLKELGRKVKAKLSIGGSVKDGCLLLQGDVRTKAIAIFQELGVKDIK